MSPQALLFLAALPLVAAPIPKDGDRTVAVLGDTKPNPEQPRFLQYHAWQLRSRTVVEAVLRKPGVAGLLPLGLKEDPVKWVLKRLKTEVAPKKNTFTVWVEMPDVSRRNQAILINTIVEEFMQEFTRQQREPWERGIKSEKESLKRDQWLLARVQAEFRRSGDPREAKEAQSLQETIELRERWIERARRKLREPLRLTVLQKPQEKP